jgi:hypothetical protein
MRHSRFPGSRTFRARSSHRFAFARYSRFFVGIAHEPTFPNGPHQTEADSISSKVKSPTLGYLINQLLCGHGQPVVLQSAQVVQAQLAHVAERHRGAGFVAFAQRLVAASPRFNPPSSGENPSRRAPLN